MPRKPKPPIEILSEVLNDWNMSAKIRIPHSPELLRPIVKALLTRIGIHDQKEAKFLRLIIRNLVVLELKNKRSLEQEKSLSPLYVLGRHMTLAMLLDEKPPRAHYLPMLRVQKTLLIRFLENNPIQPSNLRRWVSQHEKKILGILLPMPCLCNYTRSLLSTGFSTSDCGNSKARLISAILAHIHESTTPANIDKLLKKPSKMYRFDREGLRSLFPQSPPKHIKSS